MFKSIVVAFDGSAHAGKALQMGAELARRDNVPLGIIFVIDSSHMHLPEQLNKMGRIEHVIDSAPRMVINFENAPAAMMSSMAQMSADSQDAMFQYSEFLVDQAKRSAADAGVAEIESKAAMGDPAEEVVAYARDRQADLILCGCRGFGKLKSMLLGSVSNKIAQLAECSCMTVK